MSVEGRRNDERSKIGAKMVRHGRYVTFQLAELAISRRLLAKIRY